jgi:signal recognition particle GTPase
VHPHITIIKCKRMKIGSMKLYKFFKEMTWRYCTYQDDTKKLQAVGILHGICKPGVLHHHLHQDNTKLSKEWFSRFNIINNSLTRQKQEVWSSINYLMLCGTTKANG